MTAAWSPAPLVRDRLVACISSAPILSEGLQAAFEPIARVRHLPAGRPDLRGLLRAVAPDGLVVEGDADLAEAERFARETGTPLVHVTLREPRLAVLRDGAWSKPQIGPASAESIRNALAAGLLASEPAR